MRYRLIFDPFDDSFILQDNKISKETEWVYYFDEDLKFCDSLPENKEYYDGNGFIILELDELIDIRNIRLSYPEYFV